MTNNTLKTDILKAYRAECERAIVTLHNSVRRFAEKLDTEARFDHAASKESAMMLQAYTPAVLALLQLMKEESEEMNHD